MEAISAPCICFHHPLNRRSPHEQRARQAGVVCTRGLWHARCPTRTWLRSRALLCSLAQLASSSHQLTRTSLLKAHSTLDCLQSDCDITCSRQTAHKRDTVATLNACMPPSSSVRSAPSIYLACDFACDFAAIAASGVRLRCRSCMQT